MKQDDRFAISNAQCVPWRPFLLGIRAEFISLALLEFQFELLYLTPYFKYSVFQKSRWGFKALEQGWANSGPRAT
jgi:hypothetical protein